MSNLKEYEKQIKNFINEEKWREAYSLCNEIITLDPENVTFIRLRNKIEKAVKENNQRNIESEIQKLEPLLKEKNYEEYLRKIAPLQSYSPDFPIIKEKIIAVKKLFDQDFGRRQELAIEEELKLVANLIKSLQYEEALFRLGKLKSLNIQANRIKKLEKNYRDEWLTHELKINEGLLRSQKFEDTLLFLLKLKKINPDNARLNTLIETTKSKYKLYKIDNKKDFIFKTTEEIKTLFIKKEYEKVLILCERVLEINEKNKIALAYQRKAFAKSKQESTKIVEKQIANSFKNFKNSQEFKTQDYIVI